MATRFLLRIGVLLPAFLGIQCQSREPGQTAELEKRVKQLEAAVPGVGEVMSATQLHFAKLFFAARAENWKLAAFEIDEVKENIEKAAVLRPEENGVRLGGVVDAFEQTQIAQLSAAVERQDPECISTGVCRGNRRVQFMPSRDRPSVYRHHRPDRAAGSQSTMAPDAPGPLAGSTSGQ